MPFGDGMKTDLRRLDEDDVLNGDIYGMIQPYMTANFWVGRASPSVPSQTRSQAEILRSGTDFEQWWPYTRKFHWRTYGEVTDNTTNQLGVQSTFSTTKSAADTVLALLNSGKYNETYNEIAEGAFFDNWESPNFHPSDTDETLTEWPVTGYNYNVLIGGLWPGYQTGWDLGVRGYTMELAFPATMANDMLKRVRELFDAQYTEYSIHMTSTYTSGINIKFGSPNNDFLGQVTYNTSDGADWTKGSIMLDFPTFRPTVGDHLRFNEPFCK